jgi:predicted Zn-dependent peptidase
VKEERRLRVDNQPYAPAFIEGITLPFDTTSCFSYSHSVIGSMDDLNAAEVEDVQAFFDLYYAPNNATLTIVGDFEPSEVRDLVKTYFGDIPRAADPPRPTCKVQFAQGARVRNWEDPLANLPGVVLIFPTPAHREADSRPLQFLASILGAGESSRLNRALVREAKTAVQSAAQVDSRRHAGLFFAFAIANQGVSPDTLKTQLESEIARIAAEGVTAEELAKAKNAFRANDIFGRQTTFAIAEELQHYAHYHDDINDIHTDLDGYMAVTAADIQRVAREYLTPENSYTLMIVPAPETTGPEGTR